MNNLEYFILKQKRTKLMKDYLTTDEKAELLEAIANYIDGEEIHFRSDTATILFEVLTSDHDEMVEEFFGDFPER